MSFKDRGDIHLARRIWHFLGVMGMFIFCLKMPPHRAEVWALPISLFLIVFDICRLRSRRLNRFFTWLFGRVLRECERHKLAASTSMMVGSTLALFIFPKRVVLLSLLFFAFADPLASYFGIRYGKDKLIGNKSLQGSLAAFVVCFILAMIYCLHTQLMTERLFIVCLLGGLVGAASELVPIGKLDDNLVFPLLSSALLTGIFYVFGGLI
jgi:dolichol kinase